jgi:predicted Zn-dependent peptidase
MNKSTQNISIRQNRPIRPIQSHPFDNGFRVIYEPSASINGLPITYIRLFCNLGSIHESGMYHGASHFIEHMCFKGTSAMPSSNQIASVYDKNGAYFNAHTEKRYTCYVVKCSDEHFAQSIHVLSEMMMKSLFDKHEYSKEKHVVMEETILLNDQPNAQLFTMIDRLIYHGSSYEHPIDTIEYHTGNTTGLSDTNDVLNYRGIVEMYKTFYRPEQMVLSIVSHIPIEIVLASVKKTAFVRPTPTKKPCRTTDRNMSPNYSLIPQTEIQCTVLKKKGVQATYFGIGFRTCSQTNPDRYVLDLLKYILGGYMSSRLFQILRNNKGLSYSSKVHTEYFEHTGKFFIYVSVDPRKIIHHSVKDKSPNQKGVIPIVVDMISELIRNGVSEKEIETAKGFIQGNQLLSSENGDNACFHNGLEYLLYDNPGEIVPYMSIYDTYYRKITRREIHDVIRAYFRRTNTNIVCVGENAPSESAIVRECSY